MTAPDITQVDILEEWELKVTLRATGSTHYLTETHETEKAAVASYRNFQSVYDDVIGQLVKRTLKRSVLSEERVLL